MPASKQVRPAAGPAGPRHWLDAAAAPGRSLLRSAAACQVAETACTAAAWAALAGLAQSLLGPARVRPGWPELSILLAAGLLAAAAAWGAARLQAAGGQRISRAIRERLIAALLPAGPRRAEPEAGVAALAAVELADDVAGYHAQVLPQRLSGPASMAVVFLVTAAVQWPAAVILLLASLLIPLNMGLAGRFAREGADEQLAASTRLSAVVLDSFRGLRTLQGIGALARRHDELARATADLSASTMATVRRAFISGAVLDVVITFSIAADATYVGLSLLGYVRLAGTPQITLSSSLLALLLCPMYFQPLRALAAGYHSRERAVAAIPAITGLLSGAEPGLQAGPRPALAPAGPVEVVLRGVSFHFPTSAEPVLRAVDLTARPGSWTVLTGPSGAGKTTLLSLIAGLRQPAAGTAQWLTPAGTTPPHLGDCVWIGQQTVILPGSIRDNIRIGQPAATDAAVRYAVCAAGLAEAVDRLPAGLDTQLGEGGWGLSTGEARRVAIARAVLRDAELWLLDEPTAHLDSAAEARVIEALYAAAEGRTVIVATHSAALARGADAVFIVADGAVRPAREVILR